MSDCSAQRRSAPPHDGPDDVLDPDRDQARELLLDELQKPEYNRPESVITKVLGWLMERLNRLIEIIPGSNGLSTLLLGVVLTILVAGIYFAVRGTRRTGRLTDRATGPVLDEVGLTAADYRARASAAARNGDWDRVLLDSYRAIAAGVDERALLDELPGTTAREIAVGLHAPFPDHAADLLEAADAFDAVCYGDQHATQVQAERVRELDRVLAKTRPARLRAGMNG
ncbi:DUF4129 domain-containing protein [Ornithinimicrobium ciconiae]|uniref:DUF4129 domain-containing protein n=1 Tax=Ornithinimicrobium ciconiae TaxID=2594265 RepID=A0A516G8Z0_9MICO|nr:DUF4129 domain-containing protein [Ornithinimicrobium ciconiae]